MTILPSPVPTRRVPAAALAAALLACLVPWWFVAQQAFKPLNDDSYITLTYSRNLAGGRGFVYNYPPAVLGTTTPLFTLLLGGLGALTRVPDLGPLAAAVSGVCWSACCGLIFLARRTLGLGAWQAALLGWVLAVSGWVFYLGMEAYLFSFLLLLALVLFWQGRALALGIVLGLLFLTRGEGLLVAALAGAGLLAREWRGRPGWRKALPAGRLALGFSLVLLPWCVYALSTFGQVLPNTLAAKQAHHQAGHGQLLFELLLESWLPPFNAALSPPQAPWLSLAPVLTLLGLVYAARSRRRRWLPLAVWVGLYVAAYTALQVAAYRWYALPVTFGAHLFLGLGLCQCVEWLLGRPRVPRRLGHVVAASLVLGVLGLLAWPRVEAALNYPGDRRAASYQRLAGWLRANAPPGASVAYVEIGYLGYYTDLRVVDLIGLTTPAAVPHIARGDYAWVFWQARPDYFIHASTFDLLVGAIPANPQFAREYRHVVTLPGVDEPGAAPLVVYQRVAPGAGP